MPKTYRFYIQRGLSAVFAQLTNIKEQLAITTKVLNPKGLGREVYQHKLSLNQPYTLTQSAGCDDACNPKVVDLAVHISFSGPLEARAILVGMAADLLAGVQSGEFDTVLDGFVANQTDTFTLGS